MFGRNLTITVIVQHERRRAHRPARLALRRRVVKVVIRGHAHAAERPVQARSAVADGRVAAAPKELRKLLRRFAKRRSKGRGPGGGFGGFGRGFHRGGGFRRTFAVSAEDVRNYLGAVGKGGKGRSSGTMPWTPEEPERSRRQHHDLPDLRLGGPRRLDRARPSELASGCSRILF